MLKNFVLQNNIQGWERKAKVLAEAFDFDRNFWISYGFEADIELHWICPLVGGTYCLCFQYSLIGKDIDRFVVVLYDSGFWNYRFQLERNGPQLGGEWLTFQETVTIYTYTYVSQKLLTNIEFWTGENKAFFTKLKWFPCRKKYVGALSAELSKADPEDRRNGHAPPGLKNFARLFL